MNTPFAAATKQNNVNTKILCQTIGCKYNAAETCNAGYVSVIQRGRGKNNTRCYSFCPKEEKLSEDGRHCQADPALYKRQNTRGESQSGTSPNVRGPVKCTAGDCKFNVCFCCRYPSALFFCGVIGDWQAPLCGRYSRNKQNALSD